MLRSDFGPVRVLRPGRRPHDGRAVSLAENAILSNGVFRRANREIGVPGVGIHHLASMAASL